MAKQAPVREVKSMGISCDSVGNMLLIKFSFTSGKDGTVYLPAHIVFWLLNHLPVNQDPELQPPPPPPPIYDQDWNDDITPRVGAMQCKQFPDALRMTLQLERGADMVILLNRNNVELMRQFMETYRGSLMDLGLF